ncbi:MAG: lysylphosphatidylglycerol synthase transmembrane domain-containing protein [Anaerolineae bacterium]
MPTIEEIRAQEAAPPTRDEVSLRERLLNPQTLLSFLFALAFLYFLLTRVHINLAETVAHIRRANLPLFIVALVVYYLSFPVRGLRWRVLMGNAGFDDEDIPPARDLAEIIYLSWFANCLVPAKLGDLYRGYLVKKNAGLSLPKTMGTILAERILDFVVLFALMGASGLISFRGRLPPAVLQALGITLAIVLTAVTGLLAMRGLNRLLQRLLPGRLGDIYTRFAEGTLYSFGRLPLLLFYTLLAWLAESGRFLFVLLSLGLVLSPPAIVFIALGGALLTTLPLTPGGLGFVEGGIATALVLYGMNKELAVSVAVLDRTISYVSLIVIGFIVYLVSKKK